MKIKVKNLSKKFKNDYILKNININFESGKIYGLIGRNGSGKSVFLKLLCGLYKPTIGNILYDDIDITKGDVIPPNTRALIEKPNFIDDLSGFDNLKFLASIQNIITDKEILKTIKDVNLEKDINKKYKYYSLGTKQKLGIAQVLMENPEVIILDEPFNGIENKTVESLKEILEKEKKKNKIVIISTHIKSDLELLADDIYEFDEGNINKIK